MYLFRVVGGFVVRAVVHHHRVGEVVDGIILQAVQLVQHLGLQQHERRLRESARGRIESRNGQLGKASGHSQVNRQAAEARTHKSKQAGSQAGHS